MKISAARHLLEGVSDRRLAEMWCELNRWGWPKEMPRPEERRSPDEGGNPRRSEMMGEILNKIGIRECLREWNREAMSDAEFDAWWRVNKRAA